MGNARIESCTAIPAEPESSIEPQDCVWARGALHAHTTASDGNASPQEVVDWYRNHGYQFVMLSDHDVTPDLSSITVPSDGSFVIIPGVEIGKDCEERTPVHMNGIGMVEPPRPKGEFLPCHPPPSVPVMETMKIMAAYIRNTGAMLQINHPNFGWSFNHRELVEVKGSYLLEVLNGAPAAMNFGDAAHVSAEQMWDVLLSNGRQVYASGGDDAHEYHIWGETRENPGRYWIVVRAKTLTPDHIIAAIRSGDFYVSSGVEMEQISFSDGELAVRVAQKPGWQYLIRFIGMWGAILQETEGASGVCKLPESDPDSYVRCKIIGRNTLYSEWVDLVARLTRGIQPDPPRVYSEVALTQAFRNCSQVL